MLHNQSCLLKTNPNENNEDLGLLTKIWGPNMWKSINCVAFGYPSKPTTEDKQNYKNFFESLGCVLPCPICRNSYCDFIKNGELKLTDNVFESRQTLTFWVWKLRKRVNKKLGVDYGVTYEMFCNKYETYRAKCSTKYTDICKMTPDMKATGYINSYIDETPILSYEYVMCFSEYAKKRNIKDFTETINKVNGLNRTSQLWHDKNDEIRLIVKNMRINGISSIESSGEFKDLPTLEEMELIKRMSTTMSISEIEKILEKLGYEFKDVYKLSK